jgi:hypothetical protein
LSEQDEVKEIVDEAKSPKTFSIINVLADRAYPKSSVSVALDEATAYEAALIKEELDSIDKQVGTKHSSAEQAERVTELTDKLATLVEQLQKSSYTFHITGISEGKREELASESRKKYPVEYEKPSDISALLGTGNERIEKPSTERDNLFTDLLWREHIYKIEDPDGNVQEQITYTDIRSLRNNLPLSALAKINSAIEKVRAATAVFMMETGEDFLAKP